MLIYLSEGNLYQCSYCPILINRIYVVGPLVCPSRLLVARQPLTASRGETRRPCYINTKLYNSASLETSDGHSFRTGERNNPGLTALLERLEVPNLRIYSQTNSYKDTYRCWYFMISHVAKECQSTIQTTDVGMGNCHSLWAKLTSVFEGTNQSAINLG